MSEQAVLSAQGVRARVPRENKLLQQFHRQRAFRVALVGVKGMRGTGDGPLPCCASSKVRGTNKAPAE